MSSTTIPMPINKELCWIFGMPDSRNIPTQFQRHDGFGIRLSYWDKENCIHLMEFNSNTVTTNPKNTKAPTRKQHGSNVFPTISHKRQQIQMLECWWELFALVGIFHSNRFQQNPHTDPTVFQSWHLLEYTATLWES